MFLIVDLLIVCGLFLAMLGAQSIGRRIGESEHRTAAPADGKGEKPTAGAAEGAVYAVIGLLLAFTFSGAGSRYEHRYQLGVDEVNAIGTAWLRLDALPQASQPTLRNLFRRYVDARLELGRTRPATPAHDAAETAGAGLQNEIWKSAMEALASSGQTPLYGVVLSPINEMIDLTATRSAQTRLHPPVEVLAMLGLFLVVGALYAGHSMAGKPQSRFHTLAFPLVLSVVIFVIVDFEYPRVGFIRLDPVDAMLADLRRTMD